MNRRIVGVSLAFLLVGGLDHAGTAQQPTADDVIAKNIQAKGGAEKLRAVQTMKETGTLTLMGLEMVFTNYGKRPNMTRQETTARSLTAVMAFDGTTAWQFNPMAGMTAPVVATGFQAAMVKEQSDFDGPLIDYRSKGYKVELAGTEAVGDRQAYHLKLTNAEQRVLHIYIDTQTNLDRKSVSEGPMGQLEQELGDYRDVDGVKVPFLRRTLVNGNEQARIVLDKVELNIKLDDALFKLPKGPGMPGPLQHLP
jgi:outer membrane lipoprotein-sorting protein